MSEHDGELDEDLEDFEDDEAEEFDCHGSFETQHRDAVFVCGSDGSEDCDWECPYSGWKGLTQIQIDRMEDP